VTVAETTRTPEPELPPSAAMSHQYRWLVIAGGLICLASMFLPLLGSRGHDDAFVPMHDEVGQIAWLWLLVPASALPRTARGVLWINVGIRILLVLAGLTGVLALAVLGGYAIVLAPAPLAIVLVGALGRGVVRLTILIAIATLITCALMYDDEAGVGLAVLALGGGVLLIGAMLWSRRPFQGEPIAELPRAVVREPRSP
jgi:hypothetical protein